MSRTDMRACVRRRSSRSPPLCSKRPRVQVRNLIPLAIDGSIALWFVGRLHSVAGKNECRPLVLRLCGPTDDGVLLVHALICVISAFQLRRISGLAGRFYCCRPGARRFCPCGSPIQNRCRLFFTVPEASRVSFPERTVPAGPATRSFA